MPRHSVVLESVWQFRVLLGSPGVVGQHHIDPDIVSERASNHTQRGTAGPVVLKPMTAEEAQGISVDRQFRIVDTDGNELPVRSIQVMESRCEAKDYSTLLRELPITALVNGSVWTVFIVFDAPVG
jgi:hypothetical protein